MRAAVLAIVVSGLVLARDARACGGFFCNSPTPVDQAAEQIAFVQTAAGGETYVQISFTGTASEFGWLVPVTQAPTNVEVADPNIFTELSQLTAPKFEMPPSPSTTDCGSSCAEFTSTPDVRGGGAGVVIDGEGEVGPYDWAVLQSGSADELVQWLDDNHYNASSDATTIIQQYLDEGSKFVALKLRPEAQTTDLKPVKLTFPTFEPCVPLRLTSVSSTPELGVAVYVLAATRALPEGYAPVEVDFSQVHFDFSQPDGTNYETVFESAVQAAGGQAFVTEFAGRSSTLLPQATSDSTRALLMEAPYVTRLFTTLSPAEMTADPRFTLAAPGKLADVTNVHVISGGALEGLAGLPFLALALAALRPKRRAAAG